MSSEMPSSSALDAFGETGCASIPLQSANKKLCETDAVDFAHSARAPMIRSIHKPPSLAMQSP
eukprot:8191195-Karenia_brevis.AAC.1